jgi:hypothetical protein
VTRRSIGLLSFGLSVGLSSVLAFAADLSRDPLPEGFAGSWTLEPGRSHFVAPGVPEQMLIRMEKQAQGLHYQSRTRYPDGRGSRCEFTANFDGTPALVVGRAGLLAPVSLHLLNERMIEANYTLGLRPIAWSRWALNSSATELTVTTSYLDADGEKRENIAVFIRSSGSEGAASPGHTIPVEQKD